MFATDISVPPSFDFDFYRKDKPFLQSKDEAYSHFHTVGRREGLKGSPACDLGYLLRYVRDLRAEKMLEIGPGCSPKLRGDNVRYFDVKSREELLQRYSNEAGVDQIPEEIHYVDATGSLSSIQDKFEVVFSSHMIEHSLDLVAHLQEVEALLSDNGLYVIVAPNKKYTFDHFKPASVVEDVLVKHFESQQRRCLSLRSVLLETNRRTHNSPARHWANDHGEVQFNAKETLKSITQFESIARNSVAMSGYHNWIFTEDSFGEIVGALHGTKLISMRLLASYNTPFGGMSFSAILGKGDVARRPA